MTTEASFHTVEIEMEIENAKENTIIFSLAFPFSYDLGIGRRTLHTFKVKKRRKMSLFRVISPSHFHSYIFILRSSAKSSKTLFTIQFSYYCIGTKELAVGKYPTSSKMYHPFIPAIN